jgi:hypothetical protein
MLNILKNFNKKMIFPGIFLMIVWANDPDFRFFNLPILDPKN